MRRIDGQQARIEACYSNIFLVFNSAASLRPIRSARGQGLEIRQRVEEEYLQDGTFWKLGRGKRSQYVMALIVSLAVSCPSTTNMSQYPAPPPTYQPTSPAPNNKYYDASSPLLGSPRSQSAQGPSGTNGFYDQPAEGDLPDDFKYGTTVSESSPEIRNAFVRKVYSILCTL